MKKKEAFYAELEVLLKAGLDLRTALELSVENQTNNKDRQLFEGIKKALIAGHSLSLAMKQSGRFSAYEIYSLEIAEESGKLMQILRELAQYFAKNIQYRRMLISALSYPILVIFVALLALVFLLNFLVPLFGDIYKRLDQELPDLTLLIINLSDLINRHIGIFSLSIILFSVFLFLKRKKNWFRRIGSFLILNLPIFGRLIKKVYLARFCQAMSFLIGAKVPVLKSLQLIQKMVGFYPIEQSVPSIQENILEGEAFYQCLQAFSFYPKRMVALIKVGEESNQLDTMFAKLANQYNDEVEQQTKMLGSLIEPILIVFLALIVGLVLIAMYLPIFKLVTNFGI